MRTLGPRALLLWLSACLVSALPLSGQTLAGPAAAQHNRVVASDAAPVQLPGHTPAWATARNDLGPVPDDRSVALTFGIARAPEVQAAFEQLLQKQQTPGSPRYHQWLSPEQIGLQFGPTAHDLDALTAWLTARGFSVTSISPSRVLVQASAPAVVVGAALHTSLHRYAFGPHAESAQASTSDPTLPAELAPLVSFVSGLADPPLHGSLRREPIALPGTAAAGPTANVAAPGQGIAPAYTTSGGSHYQLPNDFAKIYNINPSYTAGVTGTGQKVAILAASRLQASDLTTWESLSNLSSYVPNYIVPAGLSDPGTTADGNQDEATLDFERVYGTAPGSTVDMLVAANALTFTNTNLILQYEINTLQDPILNLSFGICEAQVTPSFIRNEDTLFSQAAAQGISVFVSSGDSGAAGCEVHGQAPPATTPVASANAFCASSYVTCVGGTEFSDFTSPTTYWSTTNTTPGYLSALGYIPEGAFNEPTSVNSAGATVYQIFSTGGGASATIAKPSWQTGTGVPSDGARDSPDLSFSASIHDGYIGCLGYTGYDCQGSHGALVFGGTSASAPSMAGIAALLNQKIGTRQGNLNPLLYKLAASRPAVFHDATPATSGVSNCTTATASTCNNSTPGPAGLTGGLAGYALTTGYDLSTGLGSLDVTAFLTAAALPAPTGTISASATSITISQTTTLTATLSGASGTPTGTVQFYSNGTALGGPVAVTAGVATTSALAFPLASTYAITAVYSGDAAFSSVTLSGVTLTVTNPAAVASATTLTVAPPSGTTVTTFTYTAQVTSAVSTTTAVPTGTVQFFVDGAMTGAPVALVAGSASLSRTAAAGTRSIKAVYSGDSNYSASTSNSVTATVAALASSTAINISPSTTGVTGNVVFTATVSGVAGQAVPTGTVALYQGTALVGTLTLSNGTASGTLTGTAASPFPVGVYPFSFVYSGDAIYSASTSPTANLTVVASAGVGLSASPTSLSVVRGTTANSSITAVSNGSFTGAVALTCTVTSANTGAVLPTCNLSPASVTLTAGGSASSALSLTAVTAKAIQGGASAANHELPIGRGLSGLAVCSLFLFLLPGVRRRGALQRWHGLAAALLLTGATMMFSGCGSSSGSSTTTTPGTTTGTYTVTVTATSGSTTASTSLTATVQ